MNKFKTNSIRMIKKCRMKVKIDNMMIYNNNNLHLNLNMEPLEEIKFNQFLSYRDEDEVIYGFDITSLFNLFSKNGNINNNPYNRKKKFTAFNHA